MSKYDRALFQGVGRGRRRAADVLRGLAGASLPDERLVEERLRETIHQLGLLVRSMSVGQTMIGDELDIRITIASRKAPL